MIKTAILTIVMIVGAFIAPTSAQKVPTYNGPVIRAVYTLKGDGFTDDTDALNAWGRGEQVKYQGRILGNVLQNGTFLVTWRVDFQRKNSTVRFNTFVWKYIGYDRADWINYGRRVRHYNNKIVDIGIGENPYERTYRRNQQILENLIQQEQLYKELDKLYIAEIAKKKADVERLRLDTENKRQELEKQKLEQEKFRRFRKFA